MDTLFPKMNLRNLQNVINMKYGDNFKIGIDDLSEFIRSKDPSLLKEDMLQLLCGRYIIDVGFYDNEFILYIIKDYNWDKPYLKKRIYDEKILIKEINNACIQVSVLVQ